MKTEVVATMTHENVAQLEAAGFDPRTLPTGRDLLPHTTDQTRRWLTARAVAFLAQRPAARKETCAEMAAELRDQIRHHQIVPDGPTLDRLLPDSDPVAAIRDLLATLVGIGGLRATLESKRDELTRAIDALPNITRP